MLLLNFIDRGWGRWVRLKLKKKIRGIDTSEDMGGEKVINYEYSKDFLIDWCGRDFWILSPKL